MRERLLSTAAVAGLVLGPCGCGTISGIDDFTIDFEGGSAGDARADAADGGCVIVHSNGLGQSYDDCVPLRTYNMAQALAACAAHTKNTSLCAVTSMSCPAPGGTAGGGLPGGTGGGGFGGFAGGGAGAGGTAGGMTGQSQVCSSGSTSCACWTYAGAEIGHVSGPAATCACAGATSPTWN